MFMFSRILSADYEAMRQRFLVRTHEKKKPTKLHRNLGYDFYVIKQVRISLSKKSVL